MIDMKSGRPLWWAVPWVCLCIAMLSVGPVRATVSQDACLSHVYASECLADNACSWCCSLPFGSQCRNRDGAINDVCAPEARLVSRNESCAQRCAQSGPQCESCESKNWCYFCTATSTCQVPEASCEGASVVQRCTTDYDDSAVIAFSKRLLISGLAMMLFALLVTSTVYGCRWYRSRPPVPRPPATAGPSEERQPLLGAVDADEAAEGRAERAGAEVPAEVTTVMVSASPIDHNAREATAAVSEAVAQRPAQASAQAREGEAGGVSRVASRVSTSVEEECMCYLCLAARSTVIFLPCHHMCCCEACSNRLRPNAQSLNCPFCRRKIVAMVSMRNVLQQQPAAIAPPSSTSQTKPGRVTEV